MGLSTKKSKFFEGVKTAGPIIASAVTVDTMIGPNGMDDQVGLDSGLDTDYPTAEFKVVDNFNPVSYGATRNSH